MARREVQKERVEYAALLNERHRRMAKDTLLAYTTWTMPTYKIGPPHLRIAHELEKVERGENDRLMIFAPPRHGKSTLGSIYFPGWYLGRNPKREVMSCAWGGELVAGFGSRLRNVMGSAEHRDIFGEASTLAPDVKARDLWHTKSGGVYRGAGIGGGITGFGANLLIIDDPVKSSEEANSKLMRDKVWEWFQLDAQSRLMRTGAIVLIMTRWHHDDLAGRILASEGADEWTVVRMPALDERGDALWREEFDEKWLHRKRRSMTARQWQSLYQGKPSPEEGLFFQRDWFRATEKPWSHRDAEAGRLRIYAASDIATTMDSGDWTVHVLVGIDPDDRIHVVDMWRGRVTADLWIKEMIRLAKLWKPLMWAFGRGGLYRGIEPLIVKMTRDERTFFARTTIPEVVSKETRAQAFQALMSNGFVYWDTRAPWYGEAESELLQFPTGTDDIVDSLSLIGKMVHGMVHGRNPDVTKTQIPVMKFGSEQPSEGDGTRPMTMRELVNLGTMRIGRMKRRWRGGATP